MNIVLVKTFDPGLLADSLTLGKQVASHSAVENYDEWRTSDRRLC